MPESTAPHRIPPFDRAVPEGGYQWWYLDAFDANAERGVVVIAFIGSVFSPYYFRARQKSSAERPADPLQYCAINVGLYGAGSKRWCMTERTASQVDRSGDHFCVGPSSLHWNGGCLELQINERSSPGGRRLLGTIRLTPSVTSDLCHVLDAQGRHEWMPWSPKAQIEVDFKHPSTRWSGEAYADCNRGDESLERGFLHWDWSRMHKADGVEVQYDVTLLDGTQSAIMLQFDQQGRHSIDNPPPQQSLKRCGWGMQRLPRAGAPLTLRRTLEDTPFYSRSLLNVGGSTQPGVAMHESLSLQRFRKAWVRTLLPFRMPRKWWE